MNKLFLIFLTLGLQIASITNANARKSRIIGDTAVLPYNTYLYVIKNTKPNRQYEWAVVGGSICKKATSDSVYITPHSQLNPIIKAWNKKKPKDTLFLQTYLPRDTIALSGDDVACVNGFSEFSVEYADYQIEAYDWEVFPPDLGTIIGVGDQKNAKIQWHNGGRDAMVLVKANIYIWGIWLQQSKQVYLQAPPQIYLTMKDNFPAGVPIEVVLGSKSAVRDFSILKWQIGDVEIAKGENIMDYALFEKYYDRKEQLKVILDTVNGCPFQIEAEKTIFIPKAKINTEKNKPVYDLSASLLCNGDQDYTIVPLLHKNDINISSDPNVTYYIGNKKAKDTLFNISAGIYLLEAKINNDLIGTYQIDLPEMPKAAFEFTAYYNNRKLMNTSELSIHSDLRRGGFMSTNSQISTEMINTSTPETGITYLWDFGNAIISNALNPSISYNRNSVYMIKLNATNKMGCVSKALKDLIVRENKKTHGPIVYVKAIDTTDKDKGIGFVLSSTSTSDLHISALTEVFWMKNADTIAYSNDGKNELKVYQPGRYWQLIRHLDGSLNYSAPVYVAPLDAICDQEFIDDFFKKEKARTGQ